MTDRTELKATLTDARGIVSAAWLGARKLNEETGYADETCRQMTTLTSAALDAITRALALAEREAP